MSSSEEMCHLSHFFALLQGEKRYKKCASILLLLVTLHSLSLRFLEALVSFESEFVREGASRVQNASRSGTLQRREDAGTNCRRVRSPSDATEELANRGIRRDEHQSENGRAIKEKA